MMAKKKKPAVRGLSKPLLRQINDHSGGGFILFHFDEEGLPKVNSNFEDHPHALALQSYIKTWTEALHMITTEALSQSILGPEDDEIDEENEDPPEQT
jgi:hypothetical protein